MKKRIFAISISVLVVGCAQNTWYKQGASSQDFGKDKLACLQQSQQYESRSSTSASINQVAGAYGSSSRSGNVTNEQMFNSCMNGRGWVWTNKSQLEDAQVRNRAAIDEKNGRMSSLSSQLHSMCDRDEYQPVVAKTTCGGKDVMTLSMLGDSSKITPQQKRAFEAMSAERDSITNQQDSIMLSTGNKEWAAKVNCYKDKVRPRYKNNDLDLFNGKITWGQYNTRKNELKSTSQKYCP